MGILYNKMTKHYENQRRAINKNYWDVRALAQLNDPPEIDHERPTKALMHQLHCLSKHPIIAHRLQAATESTRQRLVSMARESSALAESYQTRPRLLRPQRRSGEAILNQIETIKKQADSLVKAYNHRITEILSSQHKD